ncbi:MAG TPA: thioredoxin family protein [Bacteroidales bacterium]|nr:thioredoxin family protein [Bacteroidales bacterium]
MKKIIVFSILLIVIPACRTSKNVASDPQDPVQVIDIEQQSQTDEPIDFHNPATWLLGHFSGAMLRQQPHSTWFMQEYDNYMPSTEIVNKLLEVPAEGLSVKIVMGTWCPDSRREVPRLLRILDMINFPSEKITYIGVDDNKNSPAGDTSALKIERVPTIILYKNNVEAGRIIEIPETSLEQDMLNILTGMDK